MKFDKFHITAFILFGLMVYVSCRKNPDVSFGFSVEQKFFRISSSAHPLVKRVANNIYRQNQRFNFIKGLVNRIGFARWDKAVLGGYNLQNDVGRSAGDSSIRIVFVPFVKDSANYTNSVLVIQMNSTDTLYNLVFAEEYANFGFNYADEDKWNARDVLGLFTHFDNSIFGQQKFRIKDSLLLTLQDRRELQRQNLIFSNADVSPPKNPEPATVISIIFFIASGIIFLKERQVTFKVIAISAFFFAF